MKKVTTGLVLATTTLPAITNAGWLMTFGEGMFTILDILIPLLLGVALLVFVWGVVVFISKGDDEGAHEQGKERMLWGVIILFVVVSMWGLVRLAQTTIGVEEGSVDAPYIMYSY